MAIAYLHSRGCTAFRSDGQDVATATFGPKQDASRTIRGGLSLFAPTGLGTRTLALGCDADTLASVAQWFGSDVTYLGWRRDMPAEGEGRPTGGFSPPPIPLPFTFEDESYDTVFLSGALEWAASRTGASGSARRAQEQLLRECRRVLRQGGVLVAVVENRFSIASFGGRRHPSTGFRGFDLFPRSLEFVLPKGIRDRAREYRSYSHWGWDVLFRRAGLRTRKWWTLWPSMEEWRDVTPLSGSASGGFGKYGGSASKARYADALILGLRTLGIRHQLLPNYLVVARKDESNSEEHKQQRSLLEEIISTEGERFGEETVISSLLNSRCLCFTVGGTFFKVPLDAGASAGVEREVVAAERLARHPISRHVPLPARIGSVRGVQYLCCPAVLPDPDRRLTEEGVAGILDALAQGVTRVRFSETDFWRRVFRPSVRTGFDALGGTALLNHIECFLGERIVGAGVYHGDLYANNMLVGTDRVFVVDWASFEENSPQFLDAMAAATTLLRLNGPRPPQGPVLALATMVLEGDPRLPLRRHLLERDDELSVPEMVVCHLVNGTAAAIGQAGAQVSGIDQEKLRLRFALCERALGLQVER